MINTDFFITPDNWSFAGIILSVLVIAAYLLFLKTKTSQKAYFIVTVILLYVSFGSPIALLRDYGLHSLTMLQHIVLLMIAPILFLKSIPSNTILFSEKFKLNIIQQPKNYYLMFWWLSAVMMWGGHFLSAGILSAETGTSICGITATKDSWITAIPESLILSLLFIAGILFALPVFNPVKSKRLAPLKSVIYLFTACVSCSLLGLYVAFSASTDTLNSSLTAFTTLRSPVPLTLRADQELAGMLMWVPGCILYVLASVSILLSWYEENPVEKSETAIHTAK